MKIHVWTEARFFRCPDGGIWTVAGNDYAFWTRYLAVFDEVVVVARVKDVTSKHPTWSRVDGEHVSISPIPYYHGLSAYMRRYRSVRAASARAADDAGAVMLFRVPSTTASAAMRTLRARSLPYFLEVVGDPADVFARGASNSPGRPIVRSVSSRALRDQCRNAAAVSYVTQRTLQSRYPPNSEATVTHYSSVQLSADAFVERPKEYAASLEGPLRLATIASMEQPYKGLDVLLTSVATLKDRGIVCHLTIAGDGQLRPSLESLAMELGIQQQTDFVGWIHDRRDMTDLLDRSHIFVLASRTEGLPRALIEAMARGLACVATNVGGIPELLSTSQMFLPNDAGALAAAIELRFNDAEQLNGEASRNLEHARQFSEARLEPVRTEFYQAIRGIHLDAVT